MFQKFPQPSSTLTLLKTPEITSRLQRYIQYVNIQYNMYSQYSAFLYNYVYIIIITVLLLHNCILMNFYILFLIKENYNAVTV